MATVARATPEDCLELANIQFDAFCPSVIHQRIFGNVKKEDHSAHLSKKFIEAIEKPGEAVFKASVKDEQGNDKLVGLAFWDLPKTPEQKKEEEEKEKKKMEGKTEEEKKEARAKRFPPGANVELGLSYFGRLDPKVDEPFYHLHLLAIDPKLQRTGAGAKMLQWGCRRADEEGVASYLEASAEGVGLYKKYGYEMWSEPIVGGDNDELILWPMRRPPLELRTFRRSDFPSMCEIYYEAFKPSTIWAYNFSRVTREAAARSFKRRLENWFDEIDNDGNTCNDKKEVIVAVRGDKVLGFTVWEKVPDKSERKEDEGKKGEMILPEGADVERAKEFLGMIGDSAKKHEKKHWYLSLLAIRPEAQGGGIGRLLTKWGIERAQKEGADVVLSSTEFGRRLYESLGFVDVGEPLVAPQDSSVINWPMVLKA